ncbi:MAG: hypothetical protein ISS69_01405 [Phycisphaerae bacterium]|nr:hypothetical protein [Phycisphaerae bacterium]
MARYVQRGSTRGTGQGRYQQLRGSGSGGLQAATMILGACLVISIILTVVAWISRNNAIADFNDLQDKFDAVKMGNVQDKRTKHLTEDVMDTGVAQGCSRCVQFKRELDGTKHELRKAYEKLTAKQIDELQFNYDVVAKNATLKYVIDPGNANLQLLQISFTVKNQASEPRGNILGLFRLYNDKNMVWQKKFDIATLAPGATTHKQFMAPGHVKWNEWGCQLYPSMPSGGSGLPRR